VPTDDPSDLELIERANRGDTAALELLYERYRQWVVRLALRFTGNEQDALDVLQDTFAYFFNKFPGFELRAALTTFFYPTVKNLCLTRRRKARPTVEIDVVAERLAAPSAESALDFARLLEQLPEAQRDVVLLRFGDDQSVAQIAETLDIPIGTVKSRLHNALAALREWLGKVG
jgi:RNA polymerase sigma-70 factor (ECF subfamily)